MALNLDATIAVPAIASIGVMYTASIEAALLRVYLPVLLLLPDGYFWGWPALGFHQYAIVPIGLALCWWAFRGKWRWSWGDLGAFGFVAWMIASDIHAEGVTDIAARIVTPITLGLFPYMAGKLLIEQAGIRLAVARRFVFLVFVVCMFSPYEFRMGQNPYQQLFGILYAAPSAWIGTQTRYGFTRIGGPFGGGILMGSIVATAILLHWYVTHSGSWERSFRWFPKLQLTKVQIMSAGLIAGSIMTISRGPWIALGVGLAVAYVGMAYDRWKAAKRTLAILLIGGGLIYVGGKTYFANADANSSQEDVASALYRAHLVEEYESIAKAKSFWGWGSSNWPQVRGSASVDNWYLLLALMYGVTGTVLFLLMLIIIVIRLLWIGMLDADLPPDDRALVFTLSGIIVTIAVAVITAFLGSQVYPVLFLILGWGEACLVHRPRRAFAAPEFAFRKVIA